MTAAAAINRGFNLMVSAVLFFAGIAFGMVLVAEGDLIDKVDDASLLVIGVLAAIWYLRSGQGERRTVMPLVLAALATVAQWSAIAFERDDPTAFGDNIGGLLLFTSFLVFAVYQYRRVGRLQGSS